MTHFTYSDRNGTITSVNVAKADIITAREVSGGEWLLTFAFVCGTQKHDIKCTFDTLHALRQSLRAQLGEEGMRLVGTF